MKKILNPIIEKHREFTIKIREKIHSNPELSDQEFETSQLIQAVLRSAGIEHKKLPGMTGVVGVIRGKYSGKTIALRADMDALPIQEKSDKHYASKNSGIMHACGHDVHTAALLGTALVLQDLRNYLHGNVKLFFQPAEETTGGAKRMVEAGCMVNPNVDMVFGFHVDAAIPVGTLRTKAGAFNASSDSYKVSLKGKTAHGSEPHLGNDVIVVAASIIMELQTIVSRKVSPLESAVITIGNISGGSAGNTIAEKVNFSIIVKSTDINVRTKVNSAIQKIIQHIAIMHDAEVSIEITGGYDTLYNDAKCVEIVRRVSEIMINPNAFSYVELPFLGSEDFCYFCTDVPGVLYQLGSRNETKGITANTHTSEYDADRETVIYGMKMQAGIVFDLLGKEH